VQNIRKEKYLLKRFIKHSFSILLVLAMVFALSIPAFATGPGCPVCARKPVLSVCGSEVFPRDNAWACGTHSASNCMVLNIYFNTRHTCPPSNHADNASRSWTCTVRPKHLHAYYHTVGQTVGISHTP
jgi:hypothetical protein